MQIIDIYSSSDLGNAQNLKDSLDEYGSEYFDSYEVATVSGRDAVKCYIGNTCVLSITVYGVVRYGETTMSAPSGVSALNRLCVCSKGILIFPGVSRNTLWDAPLLIAKKTNGDLALVYLRSSLTASEPYYDRFARFDAGTFYASPIDIVVFDKDTGAIHVTHNPAAFLDANLLDDPTTVIGQQIFDHDGVMIDGVYIIPYMAAGDAEPGYFINNGEEYTGFAYNCIALKGR